MMQKQIDNKTNEQNPLVTVVTATYNLIKAGRVPYFRQCVESVHAQTYHRIEHIIVDGASSDGTMDILQEYENKGWVTVYSEPDEGIYDAFNKALVKAKGKYIAFLNSDDFWHEPRGIEYSVHRLELSGAAFSYAPTIVVNAEGQVIGERKFRISGFFFDEPCCHQSMLCRTSSLREIGGFDTAFKIVADYNATFRMLMRGERCISVPLCFTSFRDGGFSTALWDTVCQEKQMVYSRYYRTIITEEQINAINAPIIPPPLLEVFAQALHPSVYAEMRRHIYWDEKIRAWRYRSEETGCRFFDRSLLTRKVKNMVAFMLRRLFPRMCSHWDNM